MKDRIKAIVIVCAFLIGTVLLAIGGREIVSGATETGLRLAVGGILLIFASSVASQNDRRVWVAVLRSLLWACFGVLGILLGGLLLAGYAGYYPEWIPYMLSFVAFLVLGLLVGIIAGALSHWGLRRAVRGSQLDILAFSFAAVTAIAAGYVACAVTTERDTYTLSRLPKGCPPDCRGITITNAKLKGCNLHGAELTGATLRGADLREADLGEADLRDADLSDVVIERADLSRADLRGATLTGGKGRALDHINLRGAILDDTTEIDDEARLVWVIVNMEGPCPDLRGTHLTGVDLDGVDLRDCDLSGAQLLGASLATATLIGASMVEADLRGTNLRRADLAGANMEGANLLGTYLDGANLRNAHVTDEQLAQAASLKGAILPDGTVHE